MATRSPTATTREPLNQSAREEMARTAEQYIDHADAYDDDNDDDLSNRQPAHHRTVCRMTKFIDHLDSDAYHNGSPTNVEDQTCEL